MLKKTQSAGEIVHELVTECRAVLDAAPGLP
jgi:hypothetical protein